jgi:NAD(P)-dependent dehydrogenase (short-subunit alcohol dehydrogenase family)
LQQVLSCAGSHLHLHVLQIVQISSTMGSIGSAAKHLQAESPIPMARYQLAYRASKAALNMGAKILAAYGIAPCIFM